MEARIYDPGNPSLVALALRTWIYEPQPISNEPVGWGFHTVQGGVDMEDHRFCLRFVGVVRTEGFLIWGWDLNIPRWC